MTSWSLVAETLLVGLAAWRWARALVDEDGPYHVFAHIRQAAGVPEAGEIKGLLPNILTCLWCTSVWTSVAMVVAWELLHPLIVVASAAAGAAVLIDEAQDALRKRG